MTVGLPSLFPLFLPHPHRLMRLPIPALCPHLFSAAWASQNVCTDTPPPPPARHPSAPPVKLMAQMLESGNQAACQLFSRRYAAAYKIISLCGPGSSGVCGPLAYLQGRTGLDSETPSATALPLQNIYNIAQQQPRLFNSLHPPRRSFLQM